MKPGLFVFGGVCVCVFYSTGGMCERYLSSDAGIA